MQSADFGINLIASISGNVGLSVTARNMARALQKHGVPFVIADVSHEWGGKLAIGDLEAHVARHSSELRHPVNLYVLPMVFFENLFESRPWLLARGRLHVASLWWETSEVPPAWIENLSRLDAVLAGSSFLANVMANGLVLTPVIEADHPLSLPAGIVADRARFGMPADATVFSASFDPNSDPMRKNPVAIIEAFLMAFPAGSNARLAIRMNNAATRFGAATLEAMTRAAAGDARITYLLEPMDYEEVQSFYASSDVYVSLHRGEGLGLGLMESMALGKPVIATAWSGNMSFMSYGCGCPVRYRKTPVSGNWKFFKTEFAGAHAFWADPMIDDAAHWMRKLHDDPHLRLELGAAAKARIDAYQAGAWSRRWIDDLVALYQAQSFLPQAPGKYSSMAA
jgi:glycosyltransferase involved in cell wall biosynthesis